MLCCSRCETPRYLSILHKAWARCRWMFPLLMRIWTNFRGELWVLNPGFSFNSKPRENDEIASSHRTYILSEIWFTVLTHVYFSCRIIERYKTAGFPIHILAGLLPLYTICSEAFDLGRTFFHDLAFMLVLSNIPTGGSSSLNYTGYQWLTYAFRITFPSIWCVSRHGQSLSMFVHRWTFV